MTRFAPLFLLAVCVVWVACAGEGTSDGIGTKSTSTLKAAQPAPSSARIRDQIPDWKNAFTGQVAEDEIDAAGFARDNLSRSLATCDTSV
jgi:hypothetical protein